MMLRFLFVATLTFALASCATVGGDEVQAPLDPAACYTRDFNVYFEDQTTELTPAAREVIGAMVDPLRGCRINHVRIIGSAEAAGSEIVNEDRSAERALVLARYLTRRYGWPRANMEMLATGERGAVTDEGLNVPMRRRARITIEAVAP